MTLDTYLVGLFNRNVLRSECLKQPLNYLEPLCDQWIRVSVMCFRPSLMIVLPFILILILL